MKKMSTTKCNFLDYVANNSENSSYKYVYNNVLDKKSILKNDEELLKKLLKIFNNKKHLVKREINSELDFGTLSDFI